MENICCKQWPVIVIQALSGGRLFATPQTVASQALWGSLGKNTGANCHFLLQGIFSKSKIKPSSPASAGRLFFTTEPPAKPKKAGKSS